MSGLVEYGQNLMSFQAASHFHVNILQAALNSLQHATSSASKVHMLFVHMHLRHEATRRCMHGETSFSGPERWGKRRDSCSACGLVHVRWTFSFFDSRRSMCLLWTEGRAPPIGLARLGLLVG